MDYVVRMNGAPFVVYKESIYGAAKAKAMAEGYAEMQRTKTKGGLPYNPKSDANWSAAARHKWDVVAE